MSRTASLSKVPVPTRQELCRYSKRRRLALCLNNLSELLVLVVARLIARFLRDIPRAPLIPQIWRSTPKWLGFARNAASYNSSAHGAGAGVTAVRQTPPAGAGRRWPPPVVFEPPITVTPAKNSGGCQDLGAKSIFKVSQSYLRLDNALLQRPICSSFSVFPDLSIKEK